MKIANKKLLFFDINTPIGHMENNFDCEVTLDFGSKTGTQMTQTEKNCDRRICSIEKKRFFKLCHPSSGRSIEVNVSCRH
jgi:hypothetical protein